MGQGSGVEAVEGSHSKSPGGAGLAGQRLDAIRLVLVATSHPGNIGSAARAMKAMGIHRLVLVNPKRFPDPEAVALASGAADLLDQALVVPTLAEALSGTVMSYALSARRRELSHRALALREAAAEAIGQCDAAVSGGATGRGDAGPVAFVFGTEMSGLSNDELIACQALVHIPVDPAFSSLNLAQAVQLVAYELRLAAGATALPQTPAQALAQHEEVERLCEHLEQTLLASGFLDPNAPRRLMERFRRLFARAGLEREEVNILRGVLTSMRQWAEGRPKIRTPRADRG